MVERAPNQTSVNAQLGIKPQPVEFVSLLSICGLCLFLRSFLVLKVLFEVLRTKRFVCPYNDVVVTFLTASVHVHVLYSFICFLNFLAAVCQRVCQNGGTCIAPNKCQCQPGYSGQWCQTCMYRSSTFYRSRKFCVLSIFSYQPTIQKIAKRVKSTEWYERG